MDDVHRTQTMASSDSSGAGSIESEKDADVTLTVEVISAKDLPLVGYLHVSRRKYYVVVKVDEDTRTAQRTRGVQGTQARWKQTFSFAARRSSRLSFDIFADRTLHDELIGRFSDVVSSFIGPETSFERKIAPPAKATITFSVKIGAPDSDKVLQQALQNTSAEINLLSTPQPASLLGATVDEGASAVAVVQSVVSDWQPLLDKLQIFCQIMDGVAEVHPYANMAWSILSGAYKVFKQQLDRDGKIRSLYESMDSLYMLVYDLQKNLVNNQIQIQEDVIVRIARQTTECCYFIRSYASDPGFVKRMAKNTLSNVDQRIQDYCSSFEDLRQAFYAKLHVETRIVVTRVLSEVENINIKLDLNDLPYAGGASLWPREINDSSWLSSPDEYLAGKMCLPGTRVELLQEIQDWVNDDASDAKRVLLITGAAGTGKSAIAHTMAYRFAALDRLGASFAFNRNQKERTPDKLFPTMARDMADFDPNIGRALYSAIEQNKALRTTTQLDFQFTNFIVKPTRDLSMVGPIVIVIDALDECGDAMDKSRRELVSLLSRRMYELPDNFRILITSRPEHDIVSQVHGKHTRIMSMHNINPDLNTDDIRLYIHSRLLTNPPVPLDGIDEDCCNRLAFSSQGLFQWAFVACDTIISAVLSGPGVTARERYEELVQSTHGKDQSNVLDSLYMAVLSQLFEGKETSLARFKVVMKLVLASFEPPSLDTLNALLHHSGDTFDAKTIIAYLGALLSGVTSSDEPIRPLHTSFRDFLTDESRSGIFYVASAAGHHDLALASMHIMEAGLKFNICGLESSYQLNQDVPGIAEIGQFIPGYLSYASRFWHSHLKASSPERLDDTYLDTLKTFLREKLLFWFEILSLLDAFSIAAPALSFLAQQIPSLELQPDCTIAECARDARKFAETFGAAISQAAPHIYISALPSAPVTSVVRKLYASKFDRTLKVCNPYEAWPAAQTVINGQLSVKSIAVSPDGLYIASVGYTGTTDGINLWDMNTGKPVYRTFQEQPEGWIFAVKISPDGRYLCTCAHDETVHIWNWETGEVITRSFPKDRVHAIVFNPTNASCVASGFMSGMIRVWNITNNDKDMQWTHNDLPRWTYGSRVGSVAWSSDGAFIASGGEDAIVMIWDSTTGKPVGQPLAGHSGLITCVAFSPNGKWLASSSYDKTVRLWDVQSYTLVGSPLVQSGTPQAAESVAFSPDSCSLASSSATIVFLWDLTNPAIPKSVSFHGHSECVCSVTYSPDGIHIISGSDDGTIRMWDTEAGVPTRNLEKHMAGIMSIAFSPDNKHIVSGSVDKTVRIWDSSTGKYSNISTENRSHITVVAISPDGTMIATASWDNVVQLHDAETLQPLFPPFKGHDDGMRGAAFSSKYFISCCASKILLWDPKRGELAESQLQMPEDNECGYDCLVISRDGPYIAAGVSHRIFIWNIETCQIVLDIVPGDDESFDMSFSMDGKQLLTWTPSLTRIWNVETAESAIIDMQDHAESIAAIAFSPDGIHFAFSDPYGTIWIWDTKTNAVSSSIDCNISTITALAYSPDGKRLASGGEDGKVQVWDVVQEDDSEAILFSHELSHALPDTNLIITDTTLTARDVKLRNDGWVVAAVAEQERLLFWVPVEQRDMLTLPVRKMILGGEPSELDLSNFVHGPKWTQCYTADIP